jgi:RNA polymerase sigma-70 factor (ECF subfamily)
MADEIDRATKLLRDWGAGDAGAFEKLIPLVFDDLVQIADRQCRRERTAHLFQPSDLVNEAYIRLIDQRVQWRSLAQFFSVAALLMRRILVDCIRGGLAAKRGGGVVTVSLDWAVDLPEDQDADLVALGEALSKLGRIDARRREIVNLHFFVGLTLEEVGAQLDISSSSVKREWRIAKDWLLRELCGDEQGASIEFYFVSSSKG